MDFTACGPAVKAFADFVLTAPPLLVQPGKEETGKEAKGGNQMPLAKKLPEKGDADDLAAVQAELAR